jgi:hypothetical protein
MTQKKALIISFLFITTSVLGQNQDNRLSLHLSQNLRDYNISILSKKYASFDSSLSQTYRAGIQYYLSRQWALAAGLNNGFLLNQYQENQLVKKSFLTGVDIDIQYKLNNGKRIKEDALIAPFFSFGYDVSYMHQYRQFKLSPWRVANSYGVGANINLSKANAIVIQTQLNQQLGGDFVTNMNYRLGYAYTFGTRKTEELPPKLKAPDRDNDGVADADDQCPDEMGFAKYAGCNPSVYADTNLRIAYDSLKNEVYLIKTELDSMRFALVDIKVILEEYVASEKKSGTIQETPQKEEPKPAVPAVVVAPKKETPVAPAPKKEVVTNKQVDGNAYYVVAISTLQLSLAKEMAKTLAQDYPIVEILPQSNGFYRVGIYATRTRSEALKILDYAKTHGISMAWLSFE